MPELNIPVKVPGIPDAKRGLEGLLLKVKELRAEQRSSGEMAAGRAFGVKTGGVESLLGLGTSGFILSAVGEGLAKGTEKLREMFEEVREGKANWADLTLEIGKSLPILGGFVKAGENIGEMMREYFDGTHQTFAEYDRESQERRKQIMEGQKSAAAASLDFNKESENIYLQALRAGGKEELAIAQETEDRKNELSKRYKEDEAKILEAAKTGAITPKAANEAIGGTDGKGGIYGQYLSAWQNLEFLKTEALKKGETERFEQQKKFWAEAKKLREEDAKGVTDLEAKARVDELRRGGDILDSKLAAIDIEGKKKWEEAESRFGPDSPQLDLIKRETAGTKLDLVNSELDQRSASQIGISRATANGSTGRFDSGISAHTLQQQELGTAKENLVSTKNLVELVKILVIQSARRPMVYGVGGGRD